MEKSKLKTLIKQNDDCLNSIYKKLNQLQTLVSTQREEINEIRDIVATYIYNNITTTQTQISAIDKLKNVRKINDIINDILNTTIETCSTQSLENINQTLN